MSMWGMKTMGAHPSSLTRTWRSLSMASSIGWPQWTQCVLTVTLRGSPRSRPCTKGVANASTAQAA